MNQRRLGILLLVGMGVAIVIGGASMVAGFVTSSLVPIYISIAASVVSRCSWSQAWSCWSSHRNSDVEPVRHPSPLRS